MAVPLGFSNLTPIERTELDSWSFIKSYWGNQVDLLYLAQGIYKILSSLSYSQTLDKDEFCWIYGETLKVTDLYLKQIAGRKYYLPLSLYDHFAKLLAKYVVEQDWVGIRHSHFP